MKRPDRNASTAKVHRNGRPADYKGTTPEGVGRALLRYRSAKTKPARTAR